MTNSLPHLLWNWTDKDGWISMISLVYTTTSNEDEAKTIAEKLIDEHLVACANFFPIPPDTPQWSLTPRIPVIATLPGCAKPERNRDDSSNTGYCNVDMQTHRWRSMLLLPADAVCCKRHARADP